MTSQSVDSVVDEALAAIRAGSEEQLLAKVRDATSRLPSEPRLWQALGLLHRAAEQLAEAVPAFRRAHELAPNDVRIAQGYAQCRLEAGLPAVEEFARAASLAPQDFAILQGRVAAIAQAEGLGSAVRFLRPILRQHPQWLDGHWVMSQLIGVGGSDEALDTMIAAAVQDAPRQKALWQQWSAILMRARKFEAALTVIRQSRAHIGSDELLNWSEAACLTESGALAAADAAYARLGPVRDWGNAVFHCRHLLRAGRADQVASIADVLTDPTSADPLYPYFALAWRITGDARLSWLEQPELVGVYDLASELPDIDELAALLRKLHKQEGQPLDQSVRGGTQTDGPLLRRIEPEIRALRELLATTIRQHIEQLPARDARHPQLGPRRDAPIRFSGSWSVRLRSGGHHDQHVHPQGWFSSALYIALPESLGGEAGDEGWLQLGQPQDSLGLDLKPAQLIEPKPGRLVLFPSTMWHGTRPFSDGERLTVAFDVARPK